MKTGLKLSHLRNALLIAVTIFVVTGIFLGSVWLPQSLEPQFGSPDPELSLLHSARYAISLFLHGDLLLAIPEQKNGERKFTIELGEPLSSICIRLENEDYVTSGGLTCLYLSYAGLDRKVQSGTFTISPNMNGLNIARLISDAKARDVAFTIFPGQRAEEIADQIEEANFIFSGNDFLDLLKSPSAYLIKLCDLPAGASLEGYLYPDSYSFKPDITLNEFVNIIVSNFSIIFQESELINGMNKNGISFHEGIILASIIERETAADEEKPLIASVFFNRLESGMRLETDPTVQYALGYDATSGSWWTAPLSLENLQVNSPYNTYLINGLPPGPISNPGIETIRAVAFPAETSFYFFRAKCDGSLTHDFSITFEEHLSKACP